MEKESEEECPNCGVRIAEHSWEQGQQCVQRYKEQHGIGEKESQSSITVNFKGPDGGTYQGEVDPNSLCPVCGKAHKEHTSADHWACARKARTGKHTEKPQP